MFFKYFSRQILFSRTFQDSPVYSSTFQACANPAFDTEHPYMGFLPNSEDTDGGISSGSTLFTKIKNKNKHLGGSCCTCTCMY